MTQQPWEPKYGDEVIDYEADWNAALAGDTISGSVTGSTPDGDSLEVENISTVEGVSRVWLSGGGDVARSTRVRLAVNTTGGRTLAAVIPIRILAR